MLKVEREGGRDGTWEEAKKECHRVRRRGGEERAKGSRCERGGRGWLLLIDSEFRFGAKTATRSPTSSATRSWVQSEPRTAPLPQLPPPQPC